MTPPRKPLKPLRLETLRFLLGTDPAPADPARHIGRRVGPFELLKVLGQGGMGTVYLAARRDGGFEQQVAVKLVGHAEKRLTDRLREERQILAGLSHPSIARLLDGGNSDLGPYLVMEFVEGRTIDEATTPLPLSEKLDLFRTVCEAVQFSHGRLVVHCDLKPSNILVTEAGQVKLLDFGVARVLDTHLGSGPGLGRMTPRFASPEQLRGEPVTTASDVFALGRILEVLTGDGVPADLKAIAQKAMAEAPTDRYGSVAELAGDVRRFKHRQPVRARAGGPGHRTALFMRRNRWGVAAAVALLTTLLAGLLATRHQAAVAEARLEQVRAMAGAMLSDLHDGIRDLPGATEARRLLVGRALEYLDALGEAGGARVQLERAMAYEQIAEIQGNPHYTNLGDLEGATESYAHAASLLLSLWEQDSLAAEVRHARGRTLGQQAVVTSWNEQNARAIRQAREALRLLEPLPGPDAAHDRARIRSELGWYLIWEGQAEEGLNALEAGVAQLESLVEEWPADGEVQLDLWRAYSYQVDGLRFTGRTQEALATVQERGLPLLRSAPGRGPRLLYAFHVAHDYAGLLNVSLGRDSEAVAAYDRSLAYAEELVASDPANQKGFEALARAQSSRGTALAGMGQLEQAVAAFEASNVIRKRLFEENPLNLAQGNMAGTGFRVLCRTLLEHRAYHRAVEACREGVAVQQEVVSVSRGSPILAANLSAVHAHLGRALAATGSPAEARAEYERSLSLLEVVEMDGYVYEVHPDTVRAALRALSTSGT